MELPAVNYYYKELRLGCWSSPRSASEIFHLGTKRYGNHVALLQFEVDSLFFFTIFQSNLHLQSPFFLFLWNFVPCIMLRNFYNNGSKVILFVFFPTSVLMSINISVYNFFHLIYHSANSTKLGSFGKSRVRHKPGIPHFQKIYFTVDVVF